MVLSISRPGWVSTLSALALLSTTSAFDQTLCSTQNTGVGNQIVTDIYASAGSCHDSCGGYAFAVVQYQNCWCTDVAPANTVSLSSCSVPCPGYPQELCGNESQGLFGYVAVDGDPTGTQGGSSPTRPTSDVSESQNPPDTVTVRETETATQSAPVSTVPIDSDSTSTSSRSSSAWTPIPYVSVVTVQGQGQTVTVTPTAPTTPPQPAQTDGELPQSRPASGFWSDTGRVAGTFTAVGIVIAALIAAAVFFFFKRRNAHRGSMTINSIDEDAPTSANGAPYMVDRRRSNLTLATAGLAGLTRGSSHDKSPNDKTPGSLSRRGSIPMVHDQRLNPAALWNAHPNGSHASVASFRDDQDYSRPVLHVRNPDGPDRGH